MRAVTGAKHRKSPGSGRDSESGYAAFISHSSDPDGNSVAAALQHGLHRLARKWYQLRAMHVFLDTTAGMTAGTPLWEELRTAMDASRYFVLVASPVAASRPWVNKEIAYWLDNNPLETLIIVAAQGEVSWDSGSGDFDWSRTGALPQALRGRYQDEPVFVDMRKVRRPPDRKDPVLNDKIADVAARLRDVTKEELTSRDRQAQRRALRLATSAIMVLVMSLAAALAASFIAVGQRNDARAQARLALSRQLAAQSRVLLSQSVDLAALLAVESYRINPDPQARRALFGLLSGNSRLERIRRLPLSGGQLTRDGTEIIVPGYRGVSVWNAASGRRLGPVFGGGARPAARSVARNRLQYKADLSPDDRRLAVYTPARTIELWDLARHRLLATSTDPAVVTGGPAVGVYGSGQPRLVYSPDGRYILSTGMDGAYVFDARTLQMIAGPLRIPGEVPGVDAADFDPEERLLILSGLGGDFLFSTASWRGVSSITSGEGTTDAAFSPDGRQLAVLSSSGVQLYDITPGRSDPAPLVTGPVWTANGPQNQDSVAWSPDGLLLAASGNARALMWNPATGRQVANLHVNLVWNGGGDVSGLAFTRSGRYLLDGEADGLVTWQVNRANLFFEGQLSSIGPPAFSGDGKVIATADGADGVQLWDAASGKPVGKPIHPGGGTVQSVAFIQGGTTLAIGEQTGTAIWNVKENRQVLGMMTGFSHTVDYVSASPGGRYVAAAENLEVSVWDLATRRLVLKIPVSAGKQYSAMQAAISPDGNSVAVPAGEDVELWSIPQRRETAVIKAAAGASVNAVSFAHAGTFLAVNTSIPTTRLWDLKQHQWIGLPMSNGIGSAQSLNNNPVAISSDGALIASASGASNSVALWDSGSRAQIGVLAMPQAPTGDTNTISGVAFSPDSRSLAVTTNTGTLTVWDLNMNHWIADACAIAGRGLTRSEWVQYIGSIAPYRNTCG
jgi:WD40 repeat protein